MNQIAKDIINEAMYKTCADFITNQIPFALTIYNHGNWNVPFPDRLKANKKILLKIEDDTLEDSFVKDGVITITLDIDDTMYVKELEFSDIQEVSMSVKNKPFMVKEFVDLPTMPVVVKGKKKFSTPSEAELLKSTNMFKQHNPELFEED